VQEHQSVILHVKTLPDFLQTGAWLMVIGCGTQYKIARLSFAIHAAHCNIFVTCAQVNR